MKRFIFLPFVVVALLCVFSGYLLAGESPFSLSLAGQVVPFVSGSAGSGDDVPDYNDAFETGFLIALEGAYRVCSRFSLLGGIGVEHHSGETDQGISFDSFDIVPVYVGGKYHLLLGKAGWNPYLRADIGVAKLSSVDISYLGSSTEYWDSSWAFMADAGMGIEYLVHTVGVFLEIRTRYLDSPSSSLGIYSDADSSWSIPIVLGVSFGF